MAKKKRSVFRVFLFLCAVLAISFCATVAYKIYSEPVRKRNEQVAKRMEKVRKHTNKAEDEIDEAFRELKRILEEN